MYVVKFIRLDGKPNEEYFYWDEPSAYYHFSLFNENDGIYSCITVSFWHEDREVIIHAIDFCRNR